MRPVALRGLEQCGPAFTYIGVGMMVHPFSWGDLFWLTQVQFPAVLRLFQDWHGFLLVSRFTAYKESLSLPILKGNTHYRSMELGVPGSCGPTSTSRDLLARTCAVYRSGAALPASAGDPQAAVATPASSYRPQPARPGETLPEAGPVCPGGVLPP